MAYGVVHTTNIKGICVSLVDSANDRENGEIVYTVGELAEGEVAKVGGGDGEIACLVANPAWDYNESSILNQNEDRFINVKGMPFRAYQLAVGDIFALNSAAIDGGISSVAKGDILGSADGKLKKDEESGVVVKVLAIEVRGFTQSAEDGSIVPQKMALVRVESIGAGASVSA